MNNDKRNQFGLSERDMDTLFTILDKYSDVQIVHIFGSRAKGNYQPGSDVDLAVMNDGTTEKTINRLKNDYEESTLPYRIDVINFPLLNHQDLIEHIKRVGITFYDKEIMTEK